MRPAVRPALRPEPRVFQYSLDWRFLLPLAEPAGMRVVCEEEPDFGEALGQIGIPFASPLLPGDCSDAKGQELHSIVFPFGLPLRRVSARPAEQIDLLRSVRQQLCPGGYLLLGFRNSWTSRSDVRYHASTPQRMVSQVKQAGFSSVKIFGAMPDLRIPEYIFELDPRAMRFALQHRFRRKPVLLSGLQMIAHTVGLAHLSDFLPCYFALAAI